ncbi:MAG: filamentous hemagglutinin N-terminal domain-containing protein [Nostoc sp. S13]|nr:filamentous hemagglutinin N-terminal domain-containing protein [Nostoc sp. S13]
MLAHVIFCCENHALAQITPDKTLGNNSPKITPNVNIKGSAADRIDGGAIRGANLFQSFQEFNVGELQRVYFANPTGISNILTRVTGSNVSNILGTLGVDGSANLFFLNPNGIIFGQNARLDVSGSFIATTANSFVFGDGLEFSATNPQIPSALLTVNPSALFFNQLQAGSIQNRSIAPAGIDPSGFPVIGLGVPDGKSLLLVGGNVSMDGGKLNAYGGRVELGGLAAPGNVNLLFNGDNLSLKFPLNVTRSDISLTNQAGVFVTGASGGGNIAINARNVDILGGSILSAGIGQGLGTPETVAGDITVNGTGEIKVAGSGSRIRNLVGLGSKGNGGNITIDSGDFSLQDSAQLQALTYGQGNAGNVTVNAKNAVSLADADIFSRVQAGGVGKAGNIDINATSLSLTDGAQLQALTYGQGNAGNVTVNAKNAVSLADADIFTTVQAGGVGNGGNIDINATSLSLTDGAKLLASTYGQGNAGNVTVNAKNAISLAGQSTVIFSTVEAGGVGKGGNIDINATSLSLADGAQLNSSIHGQGNAGSVFVQASDSVSLTNSNILSSVDSGAAGNGGDINIKAKTLSLTDGQLIASTLGRGKAGSIFVQASDSVSLINSFIASSVENEGVGNGGEINITTGALSLSDSASLFVSTYGRGNAGNVFVQALGRVSLANNSFIGSNVTKQVVGSNGGDINITAGSLSLTNGAFLNASTSGQGNGGNIFVQASDSVSLTNSSMLNSVDSGAAGNSGDINIKAKTFSLTDGAGLLTNILGKGNAGSVFVQASGRVSLASGSFIYSNVFGVGRGGDINITADSLSLTDGADLVTATYGQGNAGNVTIKADGAVSFDGVRVIDGFPILSGAYSGVIAVATPGSVGIGNGGDINITAGSFSLTNGAQLSTFTGGQGNAGNVTIKADGAVLLDGAWEISGIPVPSSVYSGVGALSASQAEAFGFLGVIPDQGILGNGRGGNINITAGSLFLTNGAQLETSTDGQGNAGSVFVQAKNSVSLAGSGTSILSTVNPGAVGKGGEIHISADSLFLSNGAQLETSTGGQGNAGSVFVQAKDSVSMAGSSSRILSTVNPGAVGKGGDINISSRSFSVTGGAELAASTQGQGNAGNILVDATDSVELSGVASFPVLEDGRAGGFSSGLFTSTDKGASGQGGELEVTTGILHVSDGAVLSARSQSGFKGGNITVNANVLEVIGGGQFLTTAFNSGDAGNITVKVKDRSTISGSDSTFSDRFNSVAKVFGEEEALATIDPVGPQAGLFANTATGSSGNGGSIFIDPMRLAIADGAGVAVNSQGTGNGGSLQVQAGFLTLDNKAFLSAIANSGQGGNIALTVQDMLLLRRNSQISTTAGNHEFGGDGGNITINTPFIIAVPNENSDISANAFTGIGGRVYITTDGLFGIVPQKSPTGKSDITASSELGVSGEVTIKTLGTDPSHGLIQLPSNVVEASQQITQGCTSRRGKNASHFIATGRGGLPLSPNEPLRGRAVITGWVDLPSQATERVTDKKPTTSVTKSTNKIVEAQGWIVDANGNIILVAQSGQSSFIPSAISCNQ